MVWRLQKCLNLLELALRFGLKLELRLGLGLGTIRIVDLDEIAQRRRTHSRQQVSNFENRSRLYVMGLLPLEKKM